MGNVSVSTFLVSDRRYSSNKTCFFWWTRVGVDLEKPHEAATTRNSSPPTFSARSVSFINHAEWLSESWMSNILSKHQLDFVVSTDLILPISIHHLEIQNTEPDLWVVKLFSQYFPRIPQCPSDFPWQFPWHIPGLRLFRAWLPQAVDHSVVAGHFPHGVDVGIAGAEAAVHLDSASTVTKPWGSWHMSTYHGFVEHISYVYPMYILCMSYVYPMYIHCLS